jgi:RNA polymerase sigma factor (sigma-70 family)
MPTTSHPPTSLRCCTDEPPSDEALLIAVARGESGAGRAFVRRFQQGVYGLARAISGDPVQAEGIAQQALSRAWRQAGTFDPHRGSASTWVLRITRNLAVDAIRHQRTEAHEPRTVIFLDRSGRAGLPDESATTSEESDRVRAALRQLPADERRALLLATFYGYAARDISEADGIPLAEAGSRLHSGLLKMRELLHEEEPAEPIEPAARSCL